MDKIKNNKKNKIVTKKVKCGCEHCQENILNVIEYAKEGNTLSKTICPNCNNEDITLIMNNEMKEFYRQAIYPKHIDSCCEQCKLLYYCPKCNLKFGYEVDLPQFEDTKTIVNNQPQINMKNINERCQELPILKTQKIEWCYPEPIIENGKEILRMPYVSYPEEVIVWLEKFYELKLSDYNYIESYKLIENKKIEDLTREEILTTLTFYIRGDRFCEGMLAEIISNGTLEKLIIFLKKHTK